jgi:D-alanine-D-alanine ligase
MPGHAVSVLILYNEPRRGADFQESDAGVLSEVAAVEAALRRLKIACRSVGVRELTDVPLVLGGADESIVFNLVEGLQGHPEDFNDVPAVVRSFGKGCTGNDTPGMVLSLDKWRTKALLQAAGLPCPKAVLVEPGCQPRAVGLFAGPYIVKPVSADASEGIDNASLIAKGGARLKEAVARIHRQLGQPAIIEQFIDGRELNISVLWRKGKPEVLPLAEIEFRDYGKDRPRIVGYEAKWLQDSFEYSHTVRAIPAPLPARTAREVRRLAVAACRTLDCTDYCRVDFRLDRSLDPHILEVNANPDIAPDAGFAAALKAAGIRYEQFIRMTVQSAVDRMPKKAKRVDTRKEKQSGDLAIRWCGRQDREPVVDLLSRTQFFRPDEMAIAKEVLDAGIKDGPRGHYQSYVIEVSGQVSGWVCFGPTPCTLGTFDVYWIAVDPACQGQGLGKRLVDFAEARIASSGGRLAVAETSGRQIYQSTRAFYERLGYVAASPIPDFYGPGDDKCVFTKVLKG